MRFVVPVSFGTYIFICLIALSISMALAIFAAAIGFIYLLFVAPKQTIGAVAILFAYLLVANYWKIGIPILCALIVISLVWNKLNGKKNEKNKEQESEAAPADESPAVQLLLEDKSKNA